MQLQHLCHRYFNSQSNLHQLQGIHLNHPRDSDASKPGHPTCSAEPNGHQRTAATQRAANFIPSGWRPTGWTFETAYFHTDPDEALQPTVSCLCNRERKSTPQTRTLKLLGNFQSVMSYQHLDISQPFSPPDPQQQTASPPATIAQQEHQ